MNKDDKQCLKLEWDIELQIMPRGYSRRLLVDDYRHFDNDDIYYPEFLNRTPEANFGIPLTDRLPLFQASKEEIHRKSVR